jgi:dihydrodipicolinate synthase/N-acetylneuraminate lyase
VADQELVEKLKNVHAVDVTPFREDGTIDYEGIGVRSWLCGRRSLPWRSCASHHSGNNVTVIKEVMNLLGLPGGYVREPVGTLNEADRQELVRILKTWNKI